MRLVVDSSVWIDFFNDAPAVHVQALDEALGVHEIVVGDIILTEVLQGFRKDADFERARELLGRFEVMPMLGSGNAVESARNFRRLRAAGVTPRKTIDVMIATACVSQRLPLLFADRDFQPMVRHLGLMSYAAIGKRP